jgi:hypothetical protein
MEVNEIIKKQNPSAIFKGNILLFFIINFFYFL